MSNSQQCLLSPQAEWREEVKKHFEKIKSEGTCIHRLDEELIRRRRDELRCVSVEMINKVMETHNRKDSDKALHLIGFWQTCTGHQGTLREEAGESQQPLHGAQCHHVAAGSPREGTDEVCSSVHCRSFTLFSSCLFPHNLLLMTRISSFSKPFIVMHILNY